LNFIDFEKAFDSADRESVWSILKIITIVQLLYENYTCSVGHNGRLSDWFIVISGVSQGCGMSGFLFLIVIDWVMCRVTDREMHGIQWSLNERLGDLDFADDIVLLSHTQKHVQKKTEDLELYGGRVGLKPSIGKSKVMARNNRSNTPIQILGTDLQQAFYKLRPVLS